MKVRLDLSEQLQNGIPIGYVIGWWDTELDITGDLCLGTILKPANLNSDIDKECKEHNFITEELKKEFPPTEIYDDKFVWESITQAKKALSVARRLKKVFWEQEKNKPWPEWAMKAYAEGWKPPKNWKP